MSAASVVEALMEIKGAIMLKLDEALTLLKEIAEQGKKDK